MKQLMLSFPQSGVKYQNEDKNIFSGGGSHKEDDYTSHVQKRILRSFAHNLEARPIHFRSV